MKKRLFIYCLLSVLTLSEPAFAISNQSQNALTAFKRYEPFFSNSLRSIQDFSKKLESVDTEDSEYMVKAEDLMAKVEDRFSLMEDLYNTTLSNNPNDQSDLVVGFSKIDDLYREFRDFYYDKFNKSQIVENDDSSELKVVPTSYNEEEIEEAKTDSDTEKSSSIQSEKEIEEKIKWTGSLRFQYTDSDEEHRRGNQKETIPNNNTNGRLMLSYEISENRSFTLEEKYINRERNEKTKENDLTLAYFVKNDDNSALTFRDKLHHVWYPDDSTKNYRSNLFETLYAKNWKHHDRVLNIGAKTKTYSRNSRSDYNQYTVGDKETWYSKNSTVYAEITGDSVKYKNVDNLDYDNLNVYAEMSKNYSGNKADMKISNTYERRIYDIESLLAFRTSYYDDFFQFDYELPVNNRVTYSFNGDYTKREYNSDKDRGYAEVNVFNGVTVKSDNRTYLTGDYRYIYNDENTRDSAHKNNIFHVGWMRNINKDYKIKFDETYHTRKSIQNAALDFDQSQFTADFSWRIKKDYKFSWVTEHFIRKYDNISMDFADYRYLESGFVYSFYKRKSYDWKLSQKWRNMEFRNWVGVPSDWTKHVQPVTEVNYNRWLSDKLKLALRASWEKTYYSEFNNNSQDLEYNFGDLVYNKEVFASLEYLF